MIRKSSKPVMTRLSTRTSTRLSQISQKTCASKEETFSRMRSRRRTDLSDGSEDETFLRTPRKGKSRTSDHQLNQISPGTPPKQKKTSYYEYPRTPQHKRNEINEDVIKTPSGLFVNLTLTSPKSVEKNKVVRSNRKSLFRDHSKEKIDDHSVNRLVEQKGSQNRTELFLEVNKNCSSENTLQDKRNIKKKVNVYQSARRAMHSAFPTDMPGREEELNDLREFIKQHLTNKSSGSIYVSGPPGTGKTASLNKILEEDDISSVLRKVYVNCTSIKSPTAIYSRIAKELEIKINGKTEKDYLVGLEKYLKKHNKMTLLVLDEIDQLESKNQSILYTIFEWPSKPNSHLILVGIANALDLTDRILPRLQARCELKPKLMHFAPYTKQQIVQILTSRLKAAGVLEVFSPVALQMLAGKVASVSGDVRRALDIGRRVVELVDQNKEGDVLKSTENLASALLDKEMAPKTVDLKQVVNVLNNVYGTSQNLTEEAEDTFPLQQKIIICSLLLMLKKAKNKDVTVGKLHEVYRRVCTKRNLLAVDQAEFVGLCSLIETRGILRVTGKKEPRLNKVNLEWDEEEVASALKDKQLMSMILQDDSCLGKL